MARPKRLSIASEILPRSFYERPTETVARDLLGKILVHGETAGRIVEVEAYLGPNDLAAHAARGFTPSTQVIFGPPGRAYVYLIYGMYECLNLIAEPTGVAGCVLIRALEPVAGVPLMQERRPIAKTVEQLTSGPGKLTRALGITRKLNGVDVTRGVLTVHQPEREEKFAIGVTPRIGITKCVDWPLRFFIRENRFVSKVRLPGGG